MANDPFVEGLGARLAGAKRKDNPYPEDDNEHDAWLEGWESKEKLNEDGELEDDA